MMNIYNIALYIRYSVHRKCPSNGWKIDMRTIPDHEFVLITDGEGRVAIEGKIYTVKRGMFFYFHPGLLHSLESSSDNPLIFCAVHFSYAFLNYTNNIWSVAEGVDPLPLQTVIETSAHLKMEALLKDLNNIWNNKAPGYELVCNGLLMQFLFVLLQDIKTNNTNYASGLKVTQLMEFIGRNLDKKLTVSRLAGLVNLSPDYLSAIFKDFTGYPVIRYINKQRIDTAKTLLAAGNRKVREVASLLGFRDEFHFSKVFKKYEGLSPQEFTKRSFHSYE